MTEPSTSPTPGSLAAWDELDLCDQLDRPGRGIDDLQATDFSDSPTSPDQLEIEQYLEGQTSLRPSARILHVGIGNSSLALRFHHRCAQIDGLTVIEREKARADALGLPNYSVFLLNKHGREFLQWIQPGYEWIVDNNPASYVCCRYHFARMLENYRWALAPGGRILTHRRGLGWVARDPRWHMTMRDLAAAGARFGFRALKLTEMICALELC
jgi:hypothetical protein